MDFFKKHKVLVIIFLVIVAFVAYSFFPGGEEEDLLTTEVVGGNTLVGTVDRELLSLLLELQGLKLEAEIFGSDVFKGLIDFGQELLPHPVGRPNPFAPIGVGISVEEPVE